MQADCGLPDRERVEPGRARRRLFTEAHCLPAHTLPLRQDQTAAVGRTRHHSATLPQPQVSGQFTSPSVKKVVLFLDAAECQFSEHHLNRSIDQSAQKFTSLEVEFNIVGY